MIITGRKKMTEIIERIKASNTSMAIFCTASHWNTEAILMAARNVSEKYNIGNIPVAIAMTFNYEYMPQAQRITHLNDPRIGFLSILKHLHTLTNDPRSPYYEVMMLPHLDHANPLRDRWALTSGTEYLASVMFDAQNYPIDQNIELTAEYVKTYQDIVYIEGIMDELSVFAGHEKKSLESDDYHLRVHTYMQKTGVDFIVPDLGTEQQSNSVGKSVYLQERARKILQTVNDKVLVLHGTSCLQPEQIAMLPQDGILRVNMWTRIAREAGQYAFNELKNRDDKIKSNDFNAIESHRYLMDSTEKAATVMEGIMVSLGYPNLKII
jgi:fructose/tagatose bisphosphate aldolase